MHKIKSVSMTVAVLIPTTEDTTENEEFCFGLKSEFPSRLNFKTKCKAFNLWQFLKYMI